jgi:hypothetical protein
MNSIRLPSFASIIAVLLVLAITNLPNKNGGCHGFTSKTTRTTPKRNCQHNHQATRSTQLKLEESSSIFLNNKSRETSHHDGATIDRRDMMIRAGTTFLSSSIVSGGLFSLPSAALAATASSSSTVSDILLRLGSIPTFSIVDPDGVPFMIFDGQAKATGYFFLSFDIAAQALQDARTKDQNTGAADVWGDAKIIVVPLSVALQLATRKTQREAINGNGIKFNTYNDIVPSQEGIDDAKGLEKQNPDKWEAKGRVPAFYIKGLVLSDGREPRYFNQRDLLREWEGQHPGTPPPPVQVVSVVDLFRSALKSGELGEISNLAIVPVPESNQVASKLLQTTKGLLPQYNFNKVFLVGSAKG